MLGSSLPGELIDDVGQQFVGEEEPQDELAVDGKSRRDRGQRLSDSTKRTRVPAVGEPRRHHRERSETLRSPDCQQEA